LKIEQNLGMEEVVAIVETNNCFSDGIQVVTGCTFANNALIYRDVGKTAVTVARRDGSAVRVALRADYAGSFDARYPEAATLFQKIVKERQEPTPEEQERLVQLWAETSYKQLGVPEDELFTVQRVQIEVPTYAPIFASATCAICGESVMETRARVRDGQPVCIPCASAPHYRLDGAGIAVGE
jgi:formylmethanofuran dehydrogenase subunit E